MIFNQFEFLFLFLPVAIAAFFVARPRRVRAFVLLSISFLFYAFSGLEHAAVLFCGILWVYGLTHSSGMKGNTLRLTLAIIGPLLALAYYKYSRFIVTQVLLLSPQENDIVFSLFDSVLLPAGISFFTFQLVAYAIDRYRGTLEKPVSLTNLALYVSFFPQLVAGPIVRYSQVEKAIATLHQWRPAAADTWTAIQYITFGLGAKILIADTLSRHLAPLVASPGDLGFGAAYYVLLGYSFQIYFDFYGYSLIAIGLGRIFGFHLPDNFLRPYESLNPKDFWRRWHVTLSFWIRDYLYLPLGGNRRYTLNIAIIFAVCGLWHGADWTFVIWGLYHALLVAGYSAIAGPWDRLPRLVQIILTFLLVSLGWSLFVFDFSNTVDFLGSLILLGSGTVNTPPVEAWGILIAAVIACYVIHFEAAARHVFIRASARVAYAGLLGLLFLAALMFVDVSDTFIYFRF